jgi:hypothetical protein
MQHNRSGGLRPSFTVLLATKRPVVLAAPVVYLGIRPRNRKRPAELRRTDQIGPRIMTTFDKREEGFERKYALDEEQKFKAEARRNKLLGLWVAEQLGVTGDAAAAYAKEVVAADFEEAGDADVVRKVTKDLADKGIMLTESQIRAKMDELYAQAVVQVKAGT